MTLNSSTPWHKASFDKFLNERLPELLAERLPLAGYQVAEMDTHTCRVMFALATSNGDVEVVYDAIPQLDTEGVFQVDEAARVVLPIAEHERLDSAAIRCVGEQLYDFIAARLGQASLDLPWDAALARAWLPLDTWIADFMGEAGQRLETTNWLARQAHLRSLLVQDPEQVIAPGQLGRVCPFETPEGPNIGRVLRVAVGAEIRDGKIITVDDRPEAKLGLSASMTPFLEHDDPNRLLMGANMMRQWVPQQTPEPALVQTGSEPDAILVSEFWTGRNLFTAFVSWGAGTFEDGIIISESCARRFDTPYPLQVGDKLSNRHGTKGVISQILPDAAMPHLPDGTPVELVFNFANLHRRMNFGQIREAVMGRIARVEGETVIVPPFAAPDEAGLRKRLVAAGLPGSGMETLTQGGAATAIPLAQPSTVGWVYWGRLFHLAKDKLRVAVGADWGQMQGLMECQALREVGALENLRETLNTCSIRRPDNDTLVDRVIAAPILQAGPPTPLFADLVRRLRIGGIEVHLAGERLTFQFAPPDGDVLKLAHPVPHPWLRERQLAEIGVPSGLKPVSLPQGGPWASPVSLPAAYERVVETNRRLARMLAGQTPDRLLQETEAQLAQHVQTLFDALLLPVHLWFRDRQNFSGRAVITPGADLCLDQVGLPEDMAWGLFGPLAARELGGDRDAVEARSECAAQALDAVMVRSWVIINRAPTWSPTAILAFHPVRIPGYAIRIQPLICKWLNADFDGDQVAVILPLTEAAQREAGERLSVVGHLRRDPNLLASLLPPLDALWGLAALSQTPGGLDEIAELAGEPVIVPGGFVTPSALAKTLHKVLARDGVDALLPRLERLAQRGFEVAKASGASLSPFVDAAALLSPKPLTDTPSAWEAYLEEVAEVLASPTDCAPASLEPQCLMARARGHGLEQLAWLITGRGAVQDAAGNTVIVRHSYVEGLTPEEMFASVANARKGLAQVMVGWDQMNSALRERGQAQGFSVLARARRAKHPGIVFARAAAAHEVDLLTDVESRLLVGLPVD